MKQIRNIFLLATVIASVFCNGDTFHSQENTEQSETKSESQSKERPFKKINFNSYFPQQYDSSIKQVNGQPISAIRFLPDGKSLAVAASNKLYILDFLTANVKNEIQPFDSDNVSEMYFSKNGAYLVVLSGTSKIRVINVKTKKTILEETLKTGFDKQNAIFSPDSSKLAIVDRDAIKVFDLNSQKQLNFFKYGIKEKPEHKNKENVIEFSPDSKTIAILKNSNPEKLAQNIEIYDVTTGKLTSTEKFPANINSFQFSPNGLMIAAAGEDDISRIRVIGDAGQSYYKYETMHGGAAGKLAFLPDGSKLLVSDKFRNNPIQVFDLKQGKVIEKIAINNLSSGISDIQFSENEKDIFFKGRGSADQVLNFKESFENWNTSNDWKANYFSHKDRTFQDVQMSPVGGRIAVRNETAGNRDTIDLFDTKLYPSNKVGPGVK